MEQATGKGAGPLCLRPARQQVTLHTLHPLTGYDPLIDSMGNHPKDRHVLAAAAKCGARVIVTCNQRDFPTASTVPWRIEVQCPGAF